MVDLIEALALEENKLREMIGHLDRGNRLFHNRREDITEHRLSDLKTNLKEIVLLRKGYQVEVAGTH